MLYQFDEFLINLKSGKIEKGTDTHHLRAKTLQVLTYLLKHPDEVVSKQQLLDEIWSDVVVQEQVLVQSIKEIRDLLGSDTIKTFPRKGYQWVATIQVVTNEGTTKTRSLGWFTFIVTCILVLTGLLIYKGSPPASLSVVVLPIENQIQDNQHKWVSLKGMDSLNQQFAEQHHLNVIDSETLLFAIQRNDRFAQLNQEEQAFYVQKSLYADLVVATQVSGFPNDLSLKYSVYTPFDRLEGVIFSQTVQHALELLVEKVASHYGQFIQQQSVASNQHFVNQAFARGLEHYLNRDFDVAQAYFKTALNEDSSLYQARRYLAASYANLGMAQRGVELLERNSELALNNNQLKEAFRSQLMLGYILINWPNSTTERTQALQRAQQAIELALKLAQDQQDTLFIAYSLEELGKIKRLQGQYLQAKYLLNRALTYHQKVPVPYSQTATLIELAYVAAAESEFAEMDAYFSRAMAIAEKHDVPSNKIWVLLAEAEIQRQLKQDSSAKILADQAATIAEQAKDSKLVARVEAWFGRNRLYEIN